MDSLGTCSDPHVVLISSSACEDQKEFREREREREREPLVYQFFPPFFPPPVENHQLGGEFAPRLFRYRNLVIRLMVYS